MGYGSKVDDAKLQIEICETLNDCGLLLSIAANSTARERIDLENGNIKGEEQSSSTILPSYESIKQNLELSLSQVLLFFRTLLDNHRKQLVLYHRQRLANARQKIVNM